MYSLMRDFKKRKRESKKKKQPTTTPLLIFTDEKNEIQTKSSASKAEMKPEKLAALAKEENSFKCNKEDPNPKTSSIIHFCLSITSGKQMNQRECKMLRLGNHNCLS